MTNDRQNDKQGQTMNKDKRQMTNNDKPTIFWMHIMKADHLGTWTTWTKKVKLNWISNRSIFSEIIEFQENGGSGGIQTKIPNWPFYIGIAAVTLSHCAKRYRPEEISPAA